MSIKLAVSKVPSSQKLPFLASSVTVEAEESANPSQPNQETMKLCVVCSLSWMFGAVCTTLCTVLHDMECGRRRLLVHRYLCSQLDVTLAIYARKERMTTDVQRELPTLISDSRLTMALLVEKQILNIIKQKCFLNSSVVIRYD